MLQNQGMNWNFLEALPKRRKAMGAHAKLGLLDALFSSPKISLSWPVGGLVLITNIARVGGM